MQKRKKYGIERLVGQNIDEMIWLRLNRLKSVGLCRKILKKRNEKLRAPLDNEIIEKKAIGMSSAIESAIGYLDGQTTNLNSRILSRYYELLQMTIAEQVSAVDNDKDLEKIQKYTELGHGISTIQDPNGEFPNNYYIYILNSGYFYSYAKHLGYRRAIRDIAFQQKIKKFEDLDDEDKAKLIPLTSLFRRISELRPIVYEYLDQNPLTFHIVHSPLNEPQVVAENKVTKLGLFPENGKISDYGHDSFNWPFEIIEITEKQFKVEFTHPNEGYWHEYLNIYKSDYCGSSYIIPLLGKIEDPILINLLLMYSLSIIVRYQPNLWYRISQGDLNHIGSLIDYYISIFDHIIPLNMLERITQKRIEIFSPGSLYAPI